MIVIVSGVNRDVLTLSLSYTSTVKVKVPAVVGVPLTWPVDGLIVSPGGGVPASISQL